MSFLQEKKQYTYADYLTWSEDERWEIIDGVPYLQAAPSPSHQLITGELYRQFANYLQGKTCEAYLAPFCVRLTNGDEKQNEDIKKVVEPDITIVCDKSKIDEKGCNGTPDLIVEVMSPSSIKHDRVIKFNKYEQAGVKEYWIVEPEGKIISVFTLQSSDRYGRPEIYTEDDKVTVFTFPELVVDLSIVFPKI
ncbi:MAG: Uma2 family endonuclease [Firmicutes bacterium HGW-Firmicutes-1]|nr:MAG: Uma2 family endonuclease [Firmicutes bacterium HGW-Firmicutes-1]